MDHRTIDEIDKTILDNYYKLVHEQQNVRLTAACSTFKILDAFRKRSPEKFNENLNYSIDRLVAGLASKRKEAPRGYGTLLLEILSSFQVSTERLLTIAQQKFGHIGKKVEPNNLLGYFLLVSIILKSGNYKKSKSNAQCLDKVYKILLQLQSTKSYFEYPVAKLLVDFHIVLHQAMVADINPHAFESDVKLPSFDLLIIILCHKSEPVRSLLSLDKKSLMNLCSVLTEEKYQKRPLHPVFFEVSQFIIENFPQHFAQFYTEILSPTFFKANHNELASMGLELTSSLIRSSNNLNAIKVLLSEHVIRTLILSLRNGRSSLHDPSVKFFNSLSEDKSFSDEKLQTIINKLTSSPGSISFDLDCRSSAIRPIGQLLNNASPTVLKKYLQRLMVSSHDGSLQIQHASARQIAHLISRPQMVADQHSMAQAAKFLLLNAEFKLEEGEVVEDSFWKSIDVPPLIDDIQDPRLSFRIAYHSTLDHVVSACNLTQRIYQLQEIVDFCDKLFSLGSLKVLCPAGVNEEKTIEEMWAYYKEFLDNHRRLVEQQGNPKQLYPITCLFLFYGLQIVEHGLECSSQLRELAQSAEEVLNADSSDGSWADVLTDQIIAIMSATECSSWIRKLCEKVFGSLLPHISQTSIDLLCDAIKAPLDDGSECGSEEDSDVEMDEDNNSIGSSASETIAANNGEKSPSIEPDEDSDSMSVDGDSREEAAHDHKVEDEQEDEEEEEYLDDEQMMKLDRVIACAVLGRLSRKKNDPTFRLRLLDLVKKIVMKKHNDSETINTILATIIPLATASKRTSETRPITTKIITMLSKMPGKSKYQRLVDFLEKHSARKQ